MRSFTLVLPGNRGMFFVHAVDEGAARYLFKRMLGTRSHLPTGSLVKFGFYVQSITFIGE